MKAGLLAGRKAAVGAEFDPFSIAWDHAFWAEDPDWTDPGNGNAVSSWRNAGSQGVSAEQATSTNRPTYYDSTPPASGINSQPVVYFPDTGGPFWLDTAGASALTQPVTIVAIQNTTDPDLSQTGETSLIDAPDTSGTDRMILRPSSNGATLLMNAGSTRRFGVSIANFPALIVAVFNGASSTYEHNGNSYSPGGTVGTNTLGNLRIGADPNGNAWIDGGSVAFIGVLEGTLTSGELADLEAWAADHYGLTIA